MDNAIPESPALPYKDRGGWLIAFGIIEILLAALSLLLGTFALIGSMFSSRPQVAGIPAGVHAAGVVITVGFYLVIAAFFLVAGIGSIQRRNWARILMLIGSALWLTFGVLGTLFFLFVLPKIMAAHGAVPPGAQHVERVVMGVMVLVAIVFGILLPVTFLIFYTRKSVRATCLAHGAAQAEAGDSSRTLTVPVIIMVVWEALSALSLLFTLILPMHIACFFGYIVRGWTTVALMLVFSGLSAAAAWLIYKMRLAGWTIAFWKLLFFGSSAVVSLASGSMSRLFIEVGQASGQAQFAQFFPHFIEFAMGGSLIVCAAYLVLLIYSRKYFLPATSSGAS
jgi:hypothetical protein